GSPVHGERDVADRGGHRDLDDHRDRYGWLRQPDSRRYGGARRYAHGGQHADAADWDYRRQRNRNGNPQLDRGGIEDRVGDDQRGGDHTDRDGGRERRRRVG